MCEVLFLLMVGASVGVAISLIIILHKRGVITDIRRYMQDCEYETADMIRTRMAEILDKQFSWAREH
jgi:hypothetical protein